MLFEKGKSGNPATQFSSNNQPKNRGRKGKSISEFLREFGEAKSVEYEIKVTKGGETKIKKGKIESETTLNEVVATTLLSKAMNGDLRAINIVIDRNEGKPKQSVEVELPQFPDMTIKERAKRLKELLDKANEPE
tara:strand:- start:11254 stop:11658 length:405 start_codon:yes stop_codon:yes gene_type:complete